MSSFVRGSPAVVNAERIALLVTARRRIMPDEVSRTQAAGCTNDGSMILRNPAPSPRKRPAGERRRRPGMLVKNITRHIGVQNCRSRELKNKPEPFEQKMEC